MKWVQSGWDALFGAVAIVGLAKSHIELNERCNRNGGEEARRYSVDPPHPAA